jgi:hypothetical protein
MSIARSTFAFLGTDESTGVTVANSSVTSGSEVDVLGDNTSTGTLDLYLVFTSTVTAGSLDVRLNPRRVTGQAYTARSYQWTAYPISGTQKFFLGTVKASRFMSVDVNNNATGASATNVAVLAELTKVS